MRSYYWRLIKYVFSLSWHSTDRIAGVVGILIPPIARLLSIPEADVNNWIWEIPLVGFLAAFVLRAFIAPYAIHKQDEKRFDQTTLELDRLRDESRKLGLLWLVAVHVQRTVAESAVIGSEARLTHIQLRLQLHNSSQQLLQYEMIAVSVEIGDHCVRQGQFPPWHISAGGDREFSTIAVECAFHPGDVALVRLKYVMEYDTIPPSARRCISKIIQVTVPYSGDIARFTIEKEAEDYVT